MQIELLENKRGLYEIWCDKDCVREIPRKVNEPTSQYKGRCESEFNYYVEQMRSFNSGKGSGPKTVKSVTI
jgi:hypothetical protein